MNKDKHEWAVGDLCACTYDNVGHGLLYRVTNVEKLPRNAGTHELFTVKPVMGMLTNVKGRKSRTFSAGYCQHKTLIDLAHEYHKLGMFISEEARARGADDKVDDA